MADSPATNPAVIPQLLDALDALSGLHPGFRPAHAKGLMCTGTFTPSPEAAKLTRAPHADRPSTPVTVRYSDSTGVPTIPDNDPQRSGPRGIAVPLPPGRPCPHRHRRPLHQRLPRPHGRGVPGVPACRGCLRGGQARGARGLPRGASQREAVRRNAQADPDQLRAGGVLRRHVLQVHQCRGVSRHGRFRIRPEEGTEYLADEQAAAKSANFLFEEIGQRLAKGPIRLGVFVQLAEDGDDVTDASVTLAGEPPGDPVRHDHPDGARGRQRAGEAEDHLRPAPASRWHRFVRRSAHRGALGALPAERAQAAGCDGDGRAAKA